MKNSSEEPSTNDQPSQGLATILIVDDNPDMTIYLNRLLNKKWRVKMASNGEEALKFLTVDTPDLIVSDVMMPVMNGLQLLEALRKNEKTKSIPIILLSAKSGNDATVEGLVAGADDYLAKPFSDRELVARVNTHLKLSLMRRELENQAKALFELNHDLSQAQAIAKIGNWSLELDSKKLTWSHELFRIYGRDPNSFTLNYRTFLKCIHPDDRKYINNIVENIPQNINHFSFEHRIILPDETIRVHRALGEIINDSNGDPIKIIGTEQDITEKKQTEALLDEQQRLLYSSSKMSALGTMAGGIAHELNTPLCIIELSALRIKEQIQDKNIDQKVTLDELDKIESTCFRAAKIIKGLLSFARDDQNDPLEEVNLKFLIEGALMFCQKRFKSHGVEIKCGEIRKDLNIDCRISQITQALLNLLNNAYDAVENCENKWIALDIMEQSDQV
ncbi:MAG: response regulator, partial [Bdellovibrionia bacterium]